MRQVKIWQHLALIGLALLGACQKPGGGGGSDPASDTPAPLPVLAIDAPASLAKGLTTPLAVHLVADTRTVTELAWSVTAELAELTRDGDVHRLKALAPGVAILVAEAHVDGLALRATQQIEITPAVPHSILISPVANQGFIVGRAGQLTAELLWSDGATYQDPVAWTWALEDAVEPKSQLVAGTDNSATVTPGHVGDMSVQVTASFGNPTQTVASAPFTLHALSPLSIDAPASLAKGLSVAVAVRANGGVSNIRWRVDTTAGTPAISLVVGQGGAATLRADALGSATLVVDADVDGQAMHVEQRVEVTAAVPHRVLVMVVPNSGYYAGQVVTLSAHLIMTDAAEYTGIVTWSWTLTDPVVAPTIPSKLKPLTGNGAELTLGHLGSVGVSATAHFGEPPQTLVGPQVGITGIDGPNVSKISIEGFLGTLATIGEKITVYIRQWMTDGTTRDLPTATWKVNNGAPANSTVLNMTVGAGTDSVNIDATVDGFNATKTFAVDVPQPLSATSPVTLKSALDADGNAVWQRSFAWSPSAGTLSGDYTVIVSGFNINDAFNHSLSIVATANDFTTPICQNTAGHVTQLGCGVALTGATTIYGVVQGYSAPPASGLTISVKSGRYTSEGAVNVVIVKEKQELSYTPQMITLAPKQQYVGKVMANRALPLASASYYEVHVSGVSGYTGSLSLIPIDDDVELQLYDPILTCRTSNTLGSGGTAPELCVIKGISPDTNGNAIILVRVEALPRSGGAVREGGSQFCLQWDSSPLSTPATTCSSSPLPLVVR